MKSLTLVEFRDGKKTIRHPFTRHDSEIYTALVNLSEVETTFSIEAEEDDIVTAYGIQENSASAHLNQPVSLQKDGGKIPLDAPGSGVHYFNLDMTDETRPTLKVKKGQESGVNSGSTLDQFLSSRLPMSIEIGRTRMFIDDVLKLGQGSVIELNRLVGEELEVYVGDIRVAVAEMVTMGEEFAVRLTKVLPVAREMADTFSALTGEQK